MTLREFAFVFAACYAANALQGVLVGIVLWIRSKRRAKREARCRELYRRAVEYMNAGNPEAAEAMAVQYRETSGGRGMPPIFIHAEEDDE